MKKKLLLAGFALLFFLGVQAQDRTLSGKVTGSEDGAPIPGVNILLKGTTNGTVTDGEGNYKLTVPTSGGTLVFSFIGYLTQEVPVDARSVVDVVLAADVKQLGEVVVTAIGLKEDKDKFASSVATVQGTSVAKSGETGVLQGLGGKAAGVIITRNGGDPGAGAYIQIRGQNTINGNAQPLFIVDGIPVSNSADNTAGAGNAIVQQSRINDINPDDIASVEVLKGASAAALWGTRAANGVIVITTKKGKDTNGKVNLEFKTTMSFDEVNKMHELQTTYGQGNGGRYSQGNRTTWGDKIADRTGGTDAFITDPNAAGYNGFVEFADGTKRYAIAPGTVANPHGGKNSKDVWAHGKDPFTTGHYVDNNLRISGGNARTNASFSYSNLNQQGVVKSFSDYQRNTARFNVTSQLTDWFRASANAAYTKSYSTRIQGGDNLDGILLGGLRTSPDFDNSYYQGDYHAASGLVFQNRHVSFRNPLGASTNPRYSNPLWNIHNNKNTTDVDRIMGNLEVTIDPVSWLSVTGRAGIDNFVDNRTERFPVLSASYPTGFLSRYIINEKQFNSDLFARASKVFNSNFSGNLIVGANYNSRRYMNIYDQITAFILPDAPDLLTNALNSNLYVSNSYSLQRTYAYYAQADLAAYDQLFLTLTGRREAASTYANSFFFPSAALAWQFTKLEGLKNNPLLSFGKLRLTYGQVGIQPPPYLASTTFAPAYPGDGYAGGLYAGSGVYGGGYVRSSRLGNPNAKPERVTEVEIGTDLRFFNNKVNLSVTAYKRRTDDLLLSIGLGPEVGYNVKSNNAASMQNKGLEVEAGAEILKVGKFTWNLSANFSIYRNKVLSLAGTGAQGLPNSYGGFSVIEGYPFGVFFGTEFLHDEKGKYILDSNGFPQAGSENEVMGNSNPQWRGGLASTMTYGSFTFYALVDRVYGNQFWNGTRGALYTFGTHADNGHTVVAPTNLKDVNGNTIAAGTEFRGQIKDFGAGPVALTQAWYQDRGTSFTSASAKQFVEDASTTRLREVSLSYSLRSPGFRAKTKLNSIDFSLTGRNLLLWTPFTGVDPEVNITGSGVVRGEDWFTNPNTKSFLFSVKISY